MNRDSLNISEYLLDGKEETRQALLTLQGSHNYGELRSASTDVAKYLVGAGGLKGDRVLLVSENSFFWVVAYLGILRAGLVCVPLPPTISPQELDYILETTQVRFAFLQTGFAAKHAHRFPENNLVTDNGIPSQNGIPSGLSLGQMQENARHSKHSLPPVQCSDLAALMFTSGSTGKPRGVMVSHSNIMANTESIIQYLRLTGEDRVMTVLPLHYCFGTSLLHTHLRVGGALVLDPRFMYPEKVLQRMLDTQCTGFAGVPSHFQILLRSSSLRKKVFPHLRYVQQAGGHLAPAFIRELQEALPRTKIVVMYGQTEATARLSYLPPEFLNQKLGSIGKGIPGVTLHVLDESGRDVQPGELGEIVAEGENVTLGYWRAPDETAMSFRDGRLHTGDIATVDEDGFIYVVDRAKDFLKCGGKRVSCREVADRLEEFPCVLEAAVLAMPDDLLGEAVKVFLVPRMPDCEQFGECLRAFCKEHMSPQLVPRKIVVVKALPKSSAGKILKENLKDM
jgi:acyl-CoA synthetase (AMP-forming)/AMP-acid ligase II